MLYLKTDEEVGLLKESNMLVSRTLAEVAAIIDPGLPLFISIKLPNRLSAITERLRLSRDMEAFPILSAHLSTMKWFMVFHLITFLKKEI